MSEEIGNKDKGYTHWHAGFNNALQATLEQYSDALEFKFEHQLMAEALRLDALIVKKRDVVIDHDIGGFFKTWNIFEYKSPEDSFSVPDIFKLVGSAYIYEAGTPGAVWEEGTITIIRTGESRSVLSYLAKHSYEITKCFNEEGEAWSYEVVGFGIPVRIIQSEHLPDSGNMLLRHLRKGLNVRTLKKVLEDGEIYRKLGMLEAYLQVLLEANEEQFKEMTAMINSPIIERVLEESGWAQKMRDQGKARLEQEKVRLEQAWERDRQIWADKLREVEADREAERQRLEADREAERQRLEADREAERQKAEADHEAERQRLEADREAERQKAEADREAERQRLEADREAERQKAEAEKAELREKVLFLEQSLREQAAQHRAE